MRSFFVIFALVAIGIVVMLLVGVAASHSAQSLGGVTRFMNSARLWLYAVQLSAIASLWWKWPALINWMIHRGSLKAERSGELLAARNRIMGMILFFQVVVVMGIPFRNPFTG